MMTRKQFLESAVGLCAASLGLTLFACGGSSVPSPDADDSHPNQASCTQHGTTSTIGANHGHVLVVAKDDVVAGAAATYHIKGSADHDHTVDLTVTDFASLQQNRAIVTTSSVDASHSHPIMVACI
jgi:hypothetical protein